MRWMRWRAISGRPYHQAVCAAEGAPGRGLHSSTFWLNLSAFCGIGGACRGCLKRTRGVSGLQGELLCQNRLKLS